MKILISSHSFHPSVGGLEAVSSMLAAEFVRLGHQVKVVTQTPGRGSLVYPFDVIRRPGVHKLIQLAKWCDIFWHNHISLSTAWPLLFVRKPWVVTHANWLFHPGVKTRWAEHIKEYVLRFATGISISTAIAKHLRPPSIVIPNPYDDEIFTNISNVERTKDVVFVGRLVSGKGADLLLYAMRTLKDRGFELHGTIVGPGPEEMQLRKLATELGLERSIEFAGTKTGGDLVKVLHAHKIMVVPTVWKEPFGIVALEGIACGCVVVGSEGGGLKDAIGPCGVTFPNGDVDALAKALAELLTYPQKMGPYRAAAKAHLALHTRSAVAKAYLRIFESAIGRA
jgi:glycosyltransferase involved in cell wall biosynthesis